MMALIPLNCENAIKPTATSNAGRNRRAKQFTKPAFLPPQDFAHRRNFRLGLRRPRDSFQNASRFGFTTRLDQPARTFRRQEQQAQQSTPPERPPPPASSASPHPHSTLRLPAPGSRR